jgi:hypothetical protein
MTSEHGYHAPGLLAFLDGCARRLEAITERTEYKSSPIQPPSMLRFLTPGSPSIIRRTANRAFKTGVYRKVSYVPHYLAMLRIHLRVPGPESEREIDMYVCVGKTRKHREDNRIVFTSAAC